MTPAPVARGLGPHVVGRRVVVRRLVRGEVGPSGGPAMTDLLGTCVAWEDDAVVVQPETGPPVRIALADVVSGKPVPPRPSPRQRVSAREAEGHALVLWPTVEAEDLGAWVLRSETRPVGRLLKRANSCLALGEPGVPLDEAAARVEAWYAARDRSALAQVEAGSEADHHLAALGWGEVEGGASSFLLGSLARALRACGPGAGAQRVRLVEDGPRVVGEVEHDGRVVARSRAAYDGDWLGLHALHVEAGHRRRGLAVALMAALLDWGGAHGATTAWLHVEHDNEAALALYDRLGLVVHHDLRYRRSPTTG